MFICEMYILADINEIVENKDLYKNEDDLWKKNLNKKIIIL